MRLDLGDVRPGPFLKGFALNTPGFISTVLILLAGLVNVGGAKFLLASFLVGEDASRTRLYSWAIEISASVSMGSFSILSGIMLGAVCCRIYLVIGFCAIILLWLFSVLRGETIPFESLLGTSGLSFDGSSFFFFGGRKFLLDAENVCDFIEPASLKVRNMSFCPLIVTLPRGLALSFAEEYRSVGCFC